MQRLILAAVVGLVALVVGASPVAARSHKACKGDKVGNREVKLGHETTAKHAAALRARAVAKRLHAVLERDGCGKRLEVMIVASKKSKANAMLVKVRKDGFKTPIIEKS